MSLFWGSSFFAWISPSQLLIVAIPQRTSSSNETKCGPEERVSIHRICLMQETTLSGSQRLHPALSLQKMLIETLHQFVRCIVFYRPQADDEGGCPASQESAAQTQLFITSTAQSQSGFAAAQRDQFTVL